MFIQQRKRQKMQVQKLETQLEQSLRRRFGLNGTELTISVSNSVSVKCGLKSFGRKDVGGTIIVDIDDLSCVSVHKGTKKVGLCIRMVFGEHLYVTSGKCADKLALWVKKTAGSKLTSKVADFPSIFFQKVLGRVRVFEGGLIQA